MNSSLSHELVITCELLISTPCTPCYLHITFPWTHYPMITPLHPHEHFITSPWTHYHHMNSLPHDHPITSPWTFLYLAMNSPWTHYLPMNSLPSTDLTIPWTHYPMTSSLPLHKLSTKIELTIISPSPPSRNPNELPSVHDVPLNSHTLSISVLLTPCTNKLQIARLTNVSLNGWRRGLPESKQHSHFNVTHALLGEWINPWTPMNCHYLPMTAWLSPWTTHDILINSLYTLPVTFPWPLTHDLWHMTSDTWPLTHDLWAYLPSTRVKRHHLSRHVFIFVAGVHNCVQFECHLQKTYHFIFVWPCKYITVYINNIVPFS